MKRKFKILLVSVVALVIAMVAIGAALNEPRPTGVQGPQADALAQRMERAVNRDAWERTGAVSWTFAGRHHYLWDRRKHWVRLERGEQRVLLKVNDKSGRVWEGGVEVTGEDRQEALDKAYALFINDSFWLNPVVKFYDDGVERALVRLEDGREALLVTYTSGGVTPGDAYLWIANDDGLPIEWRMWVSIIPIGGVSTTWESWETLSTGAKVAKRHGNRWFGFDLVTKPKGAATLQELVPGQDPFAPLR